MISRGLLKSTLQIDGEVLSYIVSTNWTFGELMI